VRAILTPDLAPRTGIVLFRPGPDVMPLFRSGRVLIELPPENLRNAPSGMLPPARQPLAESSDLAPFFADPRVIKMAGGAMGLESFVMKRKECQWEGGDYHHHEMVALPYADSCVRLCWSCDNRLREQHIERLVDTAHRNRAAWVIDSIRVGLGFGGDHVVTLPELCWWAVAKNIAAAIPECAARSALRWPELVIEAGPQKESELMPPLSAAAVLQEKAKPAGAPAVRSHQQIEQLPAVFTIEIDPESPETFMRRPKRRRWENTKYLKWVRSQPCVACGQQADDAHHLIGHGQGGIGTKAHDLFTMPLCRADHRELHADPVAWESKHGSQIEWVVKIQDRALALGVIATSKK
jgi:hypothetical protein